MAKLTVFGMRKLVEPGRYGDGNGLWLQVRGPEQRSWLLRYKWNGRERQMGLGPTNVVTLAEAREAALEARRLVFRGIDPIEERSAREAKLKAEQAAAVSFEDCAKGYISAHASAWRNEKHKAQWAATLATYAYPEIGTKAVGTITADDVVRVLEPIWQDKTETASRLRGRIEVVLDHAKARGWRAGENPAKWKGNLSHRLAKPSAVAQVEHHAALPWQQAGDFVIKLQKVEAVTARALEFVILTASRTNEVLGARWSEFDLDEKVWTVPAERMKNKREHRVPLTDRSVEILTGLLPLRSSPDGFVFPGARPGSGLSQMSLAMLLRRLGYAEITVHGFRSTFRDWVSESTSYPDEIAEMALAHTIKNKVERAYRRGDLFEKRRRLMADWAGYCAQPSRKAGEVVAIRAVG